METLIPSGWRPRDYQMPVWSYLQTGGRHAELIWHRRAGKDSISLHHTAIKAMERPANYWHMLPLQVQARRAIWQAVNPHSGKRWIDEAFPREIRSSTNDTEMMITFINGSTWSVLGSDNYDRLVGSPPAGIVYSEWALAKPQVRGYLRPIIRENKGWQVFIGTPRGKNHAYRSYLAGLREQQTFAQLLTVDDTDALSHDALEEELREYISVYGDDFGHALFRQEYYCDFEVAVLGAFYASELKQAKDDGRIAPFAVEHNPSLPVYAAGDIGRTDDTAFWIYQIDPHTGAPLVLESFSASGKDPAWLCEQLTGRECRIDFIHDELIVSWGEPVADLAHRRCYEYGKVWLPHDARAKTFATKRSALEQVAAAMGKARVGIVPRLSLQDGIQMTRMMIRQAKFCETRCEDGLDALTMYQREWDDTKKCFKNAPLHSWASHYADGARYMAIAWKQPKEEKKPDAGSVAVPMDRAFTLEDAWKSIQAPEEW